MRVTISRRYDFEASHFLSKVPDGHKCKTMHGHSYEVEVLVTGEVQEAGPAEGMVIDFAVLDGAWKSLHDSIDHKTLNEIHPNPTVENMAPFIWRTLSRALSDFDGSLRVVFREGPRSACYYPPLD